MKRKTLGIILTICLIFTLLPSTVMAGTVITETTVDQLELPSLGATPDTTAVAVERANRQASSNVYVDNVAWDGELDSNGCFKSGVQYKVTVTLKTKNGSTFSTSTFKQGFRTDSTLIVGSLSPTATKIDTSKCYWCWVKEISANKLVYYFKFSALADSGKSELDEINAVQDILAEKWDSYTPARTVTSDEVVAWAQSQVPSSYNVKVSAYLFNKDEYAKDDEILNFTVQFKLTSGSKSVNSKAFGKNILPDTNTESDKTKLLADRELVRDVVGDGTFSNSTTEQELLKAMQNACTNGSKVEITSWSKKDADYTAAGYIRAKAKMTLGSETLEFDLPDGKIAQLVRAMPTEISVNADEWDVLRYTNNRRIENGAYPLVIVDYLQTAGDMRASELTVSYSHTRPDGRATITVLEDLGYTNKAFGENIAKNETAEDAVNAWMYSTSGHRENMLNTQWKYIGIGAQESLEERCSYWVQLFNIGSSIQSWKTASGKTSYNDKDALEQDYLILSMADGKTGYMPLDVTSMTKTSSGYSLALDANTTAVFTVANADTTTTTPTATAKTKFTDVMPGSYYEDAVVWALERKFTTGTSDTTFSPDMTCTRGQVVTFLWRSKGEEEPTSTANPFTDVDINEYYGKAVLWAVENGITTGTSATTFSPNDTCTTAQILTFIWRALEKPEVSKVNSLYKTYAGEYFAESVAWADSLGMIDGLAPGFTPHTDCTRANTVYYLYKGADSPTTGDSIDWSTSQWTSDPSQW